LELQVRTKLAATSVDESQIVVPFRDRKLTKAALQYATVVIGRPDVCVRLIDVHVVPYGVPLDRRKVDPKPWERRLKYLARKNRISVSAEIVFARNWEQGLRSVLTSGSTVLLPIYRESWQSSEKRLATRLRKFGHTVIWVDCA
jgi:hypothetical protein